ncbi:MAG: methyltransferase domain-containing protein [Deltaproteobacteria bacterium]|nr:methyltransferase domain-containing protein [Deltaproteobacteria bacterium]
MSEQRTYFMESPEEAVRLDLKTDPEAVRRQAFWSGIRPGLRVLDAGCGPGRITSILHHMIQPGGTILGVDYSQQRIEYAREHYGGQPGLGFQVQDLRKRLDVESPFDLIWVRFVMEYNFGEGPKIVRNLTECLRPGGTLCLMDLDHNCLSHYELPAFMEEILLDLSRRVQETYNFDAFAGRKLYAYMYDCGYQDIQVDLLPHHLIYGDLRDLDVFNWIKKAEVVSERAKGMFEKYRGGHEGFFEDFKSFFWNPRRFTYTPLILCKGVKPSS